MVPLRYWTVTFGFVCLFFISACVSAPEEQASTSDEGLSLEDEFAGIELVESGVPVACDPPLYPFETGFEVRQTPPLDEPDPREPFQDPVLGTCIIRVTDRRADLSPEDPSGGIKNEYSRVQAFNADGRYLIARSIEAYWYLYDASTLEPLALLPLDVEPRWSPTDPDLIYYLSETRLVSLNIQSGEMTSLHDFKGDLPFEPAMVWTRYEGSPSADGRYWGLMAEDQDWLAAAYLVYDLATDQVVATRLLDGWPAEAREIDSVTISPSGKYFLAYMDLYCEQGVLGNDEQPCGLMVYDRQFQHGRGLLRIVGHSDLALDSNGKDVLVYQDIDTDHIAMLNLESGAVTPLWPIDFRYSPVGLHFSGRAFNTPGWAVISTYSGGYPKDATWMDNQVFAIELKPDGRVLRLAHTHSVVDQEQEHDYWAEPQATVNPDLTRILYTSNWGHSGTDQVEMYMVVLPTDWLQQLP